MSGQGPLERATVWTDHGLCLTISLSPAAATRHNTKAGRMDGLSLLLDAETFLLAESESEAPLGEGFRYSLC